MHTLITNTHIHTLSVCHVMICFGLSPVSKPYSMFFRLNRDAKQNLEMDWSDKKESLEIDTTCGVLRNHHTNKQFYDGAAKFEEM